jgi:Family of unknown function (DUF6529)
MTSAVLEAPREAPRSRTTVALFAPALAGGAVAVALGVYGRVHDPTFRPIFDLGFPSMQAMKAWLATGAVTLALFQLVSALAMYGRLPYMRRTPRWLPVAHRWSGTAAFLLSLPVAYHCLWALGFQPDAGARPSFPVTAGGWPASSASTNAAHSRRYDGTYRSTKKYGSGGRRVPSAVRTTPG